MTGVGTLPSALAALSVDDPRHPDATVLAPRDDGEVAAVLRHAASAGEPVSVTGSGWAHREAPRPRLVISTLALDTIEHEPEDLTVVTGAGVRLGALSSVLDHHRQSAILPHGLDDRTVGGIVATGTSAFERLRYGPTRDRVLGVTLVTGYGEVVRGGGRLVKNVTGFDLPRLVTGSHGALGVITSVCLKLWPRPAAARTFLVADPGSARSVYEPSAVLETEEGTLVYVEGSPGTIDAAASALGVPGEDGLVWPEPLRSTHVLAMLVPPSAVDDVVAVVRRDADRFVAQHGVGRVDVGYDTRTPDVAGIRRKLASLGGIVVVERWDGDGSAPEQWGTEPQGMGIQRRLKALFDPAGILDVGVLPGGL